MTRGCCPAQCHAVIFLHRMEELHPPLGELVNDADAMKAFGSTMVLWDFHARNPARFSKFLVFRSRCVGLG